MDATGGAADDLYAVRPDEFVAARTALAKQLRADGHKDEAAAVAKLRRPSVSAWALNQVAREEPKLVAAAVAAGQELRVASEAAVAGRPGELRTATAAERTAAHAVVKAAAGHLGARADALAPVLLATIRVAALDEAVAEQLQRGVLVSDQEQPGFGFGTDAVVAPAPAPRPKAKAKPKATAGPKPKARAKAGTARTGSASSAPAADELAEARRRKAAAAAEREAARTHKRAVAERQRSADRKAREAARLAKEADAAERAAKAARADADRAQRAADDALQALRDLG